MPEGTKGNNPPPPRCWRWRDEVKREIHQTILGGVWYWKVLEGLVGHLYYGRGTIQRILVPVLGTKQPIKWRIKIGPHCRRGARNRRLMKVSITVSPFRSFIICAVAPYLFYHFIIMRCSCFLLHHFIILPFHHVDMCVFSAPFHHIRFTISLYRSEIIFVIPFHHLTISLLFHNITAKRRKRAASK